MPEYKNCRRMEGLLIENGVQYNHKKLVLVTALFFGLFIFSSAFANPQGGQVSAGRATISSPNANTTVINQQTNKAVIDWRSFNISPNEHTRFNQPGPRSISLNRINPNNGASNISGRLSSNGQVWLLNPAGIVFGSTARVDVAGLLATTANITNADFMAGRYNFMQSPQWRGVVINNGLITVRNRGMAALVAPGVENNGVIQANMGTVIMGSANQFVLDFYGDNLIHFGTNSAVTQPGVAPDGRVLKTGVSNSGKIIANGGRVFLTAQSASNVLDRSINMDGYIEAKAAVQKGGTIVLMGGDEGIVRVAGKMDASGKQLAQRGGKVKVLGKQVEIVDNGNIDASGDKGGGEILIGGNAHGAGPEPNAKYTYIGSNAKLNADALTQGDGGKVVVWADEGTQFYGNISAKGGIKGGNGGWAEVSGKQKLGFHGYVNLDSVAAGSHGGTLLLDPNDLCVSVGAPVGCGGGAIQDTTNPYQAIDGINNYYVTKATLEALSAGTSPQLLANNNIIFETSLTMLTGGGSTFSINASNQILMADFGITTAGGAITMTSGAGGISNIGSINTNGGLLTLNSSGAMSQSSSTGLISGAGGLTKQGTGTLTLSRANTYTGKTTVSAGTLSFDTISNVSGGSSALGAPTTVPNGTIDVGATGILKYTGSGHSSDRVINLLADGASIDASGTGELTLSGGITGSGNDLNLIGTGLGSQSGAISTGNNANLTKGGAGTWALTGSNTYNKITTVSDGILSFNSIANRDGTVSALGAPASAGDGTIALSGTGTLLYTGSGHSSNRNINLTSSGGTLNASGAGTLTLSGNITGNTRNVVLTGIGIGSIGNINVTTGNVTKNDTGTWTLSGAASNYTGGTTVNAGTLKSGVIDALSSGPLTIANGTFDLAGFSQQVSSFNGSGILTNSGAVNTFTDNTTSLTDAFSGTIQGAINLTKSGTGKLTLSSLNSYSGKTTVSAGTLSFDTISNVNGGSSALGAPTTIANGTIDVGATGILQYTGPGHLSNRVINLLGDGASIDASGAGELALSGGITGSGNNLNLIGTGLGSQSGAISTGNNANLTKGGAGTWALTGSNTYNKITTVSDGILSFNSIANRDGTVSALGAPESAGDGTIALSGTGTLLYTGSGHSSNRVINLTSSGGTVKASGTGGLTLSGGVTGNTRTIILAGTGSGTQSGVINTTSGGVTKNDSGIWSLTGANSYTGKTTVDDGTLSFNSISILGGINSALGAPTTAPNGTIDIGATGVLKYTGSGHTSNRVINLTGSGGTVDASGSGALTLSGGVTGNTFDLKLAGSPETSNLLT